MWWVVGGKLKRTKPSIKRVSLDIINRHNKYPITLSKKKNVQNSFLMMINERDLKIKRLISGRQLVHVPYHLLTAWPHFHRTTIFHYYRQLLLMAVIMFYVLQKLRTVTLVHVLTTLNNNDPSPCELWCLNWLKRVICRWRG